MTIENVSKQLSLAGLNNTRDLGGMRTRDGRQIVSGKLIRSGHLYSATGEDLALLSEKVELIIDFRTEQERREKPDPSMVGAEYLHLPIFESLAAGVTREETSDAQAFTMVAREPDKARRYMQNTYLGFVTNPFSLSQYSRFLRLLLISREKGILWHCTAGKDRAGFASVLVQELLGVDREDIFADYLKTNQCLHEEILQLCNMVGQSMGGLDEKSAKALDYLFGAHEEYLAGLYEKVDETCGSFSAFLTDKLSLTREEIEQLQALFLTD